MCSMFSNTKAKKKGVYRVLAFDNDGDSDGPRADLTADFLKRGSLTADEVRVLVPFKDWRVEVRYAIDGARYRAVTYNADVPAPSLVLRRSPSILGSREYPLAATLGATVDDPDGIDATAHVQKFAGPARDWHHSRPKMKHLFVGDDPETKAIWYPYLHVRTMSGLRSYRIVD